MNGKEDICLIEKTKRFRVNGSGPKRKELSAYKILDNISSTIVKDLLLITNERKDNDLGSDAYEISSLCNYKDVFNAEHNYRQILLQTKLEKNSQPTDEYAYSVWDKRVDKKLIKHLEFLFGKIFRFRISVMNKDHHLNWHIDTDTSVICRAQICLNENDSSFEFNIKGKKFELLTNPGDVYFINTGWPHRVVTRKKDRIVAIFGFKFENACDEIKSAIYATNDMSSSKHVSITI